MKNSFLFAMSVTALGMLLCTYLVGLKELTNSDAPLLMISTGWLTLPLMLYLHACLYWEAYRRFFHKDSK